MNEPILLQLLRHFIGVLIYFFGFARIYGVSKRSRPAAAGSAMLSWFAFTIAQLWGASSIAAAFIATLLLTFYAESMARIMKRPAPSFLLMGLLPLVPGGSIYRAMLHLVENRPGEALASGMEAFGMAAAMAGGVVFVTAFFKVKPAPRFRTDGLNK